jgi:hypothetical protein
VPNFGRDARGTVAHALCNAAVDAVIDHLLRSSPPCPNWTRRRDDNCACPRCQIAPATEKIETADWLAQADELIAGLVTHTGAVIDPAAPDTSYESVRDDIDAGHGRFTPSSVTWADPRTPTTQET